MDFSEDVEDVEDVEDKFREAGFGDYTGFLKEINAVATALKTNFNDNTLFTPFQAKLKKIAGLKCIQDVYDLYHVLGKPSKMKEHINADKFKGEEFKRVIRKLNEGVTSCVAWTSPGIDVNPALAGKLGPGISATLSSSSSCVSSPSPSSSGSWEDYNAFLNEYYKDHIPYYINIGTKLDFLTFYFRKKCPLLIEDLKRNILILQLISNKISILDNLYNYELLKHVINIQIELLNICEKDKDMPPPPPPPYIPPKKNGKKCTVIKLKQPIQTVYIELLSGLRSLLGLDGGTPKLRTLELENQFPNGQTDIWEGNSYTRLSNSISLGQKKYQGDASLEAHIGVAQYYMNKIKDVANFFGIDINDPNLNENIGKRICDLSNKRLQEYRPFPEEVNC